MSISGSLRALLARSKGLARHDRRAAKTKERIVLEALEGRALLSTLGFRTVDGTGNNLANPTWGSTGTDLLRTAPAQYTGGVSSPSGVDRPSARAISNAIVAHPAGDLKSGQNLSNFVYAWGQFIDHDLDLTTTATPGQAFNIAVPTGDPSFDPNSTGTQVIPLNRSSSDSATGTGINNPRQQINSITGFLDASMVYGSDATRAAALRTFSGGKLKTSDGNLLPLNTSGLPNANDTHQTPNNQLFLAGDVRANENIELTAVQTLFMREHNRVADLIAKANPGLSDELIYQQAKEYVNAEIQAITYNEFLPALLGPGAPNSNGHYNPNVNPSIANEFSTAAFRFGHSMLGNDVEFLSNNGQTVSPSISLANAFFNPNIVKSTGVDPIVKYLASDNAEEIDTKVVDSLRNFLFGQPGQGGLDLASLNIQRGRDHGLADYNTTRAAYGLPKVKSFAEITADPTLQKELKDVYGSVDKIDLWVGGLAEDHIPGGNVGPTFTRIIGDQFTRLRDGDRFWYQNEYSGQTLNTLEHTRLADIIKRNTGLTNIQDNVFVFKTGISGRVFADGNHDGHLNPGGPGGNPGGLGIAGRTIQLIDDSGAIIETTTTLRDGSYHFDQVGLGTFQVHEVVPTGVTLTTPATRTIAITRGMIVTGQDFGEAAPGRRTPPPPPPVPHNQRANDTGPSNQQENLMASNLAELATAPTVTMTRPFQSRPWSRRQG